jgi:hypothetical protein
MLRDEPMDFLNLLLIGTEKDRKSVGLVEDLVVSRTVIERIRPLDVRPPRLENDRGTIEKDRAVSGMSYRHASKMEGSPPRTTFFAPGGGISVWFALPSRLPSLRMPSIDIMSHLTYA